MSGLKENRKYFHSKIFSFKINDIITFLTLVIIVGQQSYVLETCHPEQNHHVNSMVNSVLSEKCTAKWLYAKSHLALCKSVISVSELNVFLNHKTKTT